MIFKLVGRMLESLLLAGILFLFFGSRVIGRGTDSPVWLIEWLDQLSGWWLVFVFLTLIFLLVFLLSAYRRVHHFVRVTAFCAIAYLLAEGQVIFWGWAGLVTLYEWLADSFFAWRLLAYLGFSFLFFHFGFSFASRLRRGWRFLGSCAVCVLFAGLFFGTITLITYYYAARTYEHKSSPKDNPLGESLQSKMDAVCISQTASRTAASEGEAHNLNAYLDVLTNIHIKAGCVLNYRVYDLGVLGIQASPYVQKVQTSGDGALGKVDDAGDWFLQFHVDDTQLGYLEYAVFYLIADRLCFGSFDRGNPQVIASKKAMNGLINRPVMGRSRDTLLKMKACSIDLRPYVEIQQDAAKVSLLIFSMDAGFERVTLLISRNFPHRILSEEYETIIEYNSGVVF